MLIRLVSLLYLLYLVLPIGLVLVGSFGETWINALLPEGTTTQWYQELWDDRSFIRAFITSLIVGASACVINTLLCVPLAYSLVHGAKEKNRFATRLLMLLPVAVPTITLGFGYILVFNTDAMPWLGSTPLLIAAHVVLTLPYLTQALVTDLRHQRLDRLEEAAATLGARPTQRFFGIIVPNLRHSLVAGLVMVAALSIGEFQLSNLIVGFQNRTYPVVLLQAFYGATGFACAATVILLLLATLASLTSTLASKKA
jgi:putative spermidine/putrescine transport system permease protein